MSASNNAGIQLSDRAKEIHSILITKGSGSAFSQQQLSEESGITSLTDLMAIVQELLDKNLLKLIKQNNELKFQAVDFFEAQKKSTMSAEEALVYSYIESSGREGIWSKTIKARTNLHQHVVLKCLKSLESQRYVKSVKSVKHPTRKIYMLYHLQPSIEVTGGPWFTDSELDVEFINSLLTIVWRYVSECTYPGGFNNFQDSGTEQLYAPGVKNHCNLEEILAFIEQAQVANVTLNLGDIRSLCEVLVYDDKLERVMHNHYRVTLASVLQMNNMPSAKRRAGTTEEHEEGTDEFSIFDYHMAMAPSQTDKEAVYFDEWVL